MAAHGVPQVRLRGGAGRPARADRRAGPAAVREAGAAGLVGGDLEGGQRGGARPRRSSWRSSTTRVVMVERLVEGHGGGVLGARQRRPEASRPGEIVMKGPTGTTTRRSTPTAGWSWSCRRGSPTRARATCGGWRVEVFRLVGCSGMARVDFFVTDGGVLVNELNTIPGFTATSVYAKLWEATGIAYPELLRPAGASWRWSGTSGAEHRY